jgi:hypothetical protein
MYITNTTDTAMADPSTANKTNDGIGPNSPFVALRKPLSPSFVYGIIPGSNMFHSGMLMGVGLRLSRILHPEFRESYFYALQ